MDRRTLRYEQLADELAGMIAERILRPGDRLPSVRRLAREKKLSISTVVQALRQLEKRGRSPDFSCACLRTHNLCRKPANVWRVRWPSISTAVSWACSP